MSFLFENLRNNFAQQAYGRSADHGQRVIDGEWREATRAERARMRWIEIEHEIGGVQRMVPVARPAPRTAVDWFARLNGFEIVDKRRPDYPRLWR